ncbi:uncharacterized protein B0P05DRAFT_474195 [Gilbertella persicaria]|uniref:uncharacterized protein n=1 Tax=Gilbertella persicaria TaxID=101096 RepID=UPI00221F6A94|nr:uncharacterized protein B0P05DRAFT_474195 [Gilbertella persicaria]KAI8070668.1 hypothetical protein B0P05DRAFT_474195 [Gilbertella persicaria]
MSNGLSSILDLVDQSYTSQRKLFTSAKWQQINQIFQNKHRIPDTSPPESYPQHNLESHRCHVKADL